VCFRAGCFRKYVNLEEMMPERIGNKKLHNKGLQNLPFSPDFISIIAKGERSVWNVWPSHCTQFLNLYSSFPGTSVVVFFLLSKCGKS
jgi:hypothetical protein